MFCWHNWNKWSDPNNGIFVDFGSVVGHYAVAQTRTCAKCGKAEVRKLPNVRTLDELKASPTKGR